MAYPITPGDIVEVTYRGSLFQQVVMNVLHYRYTGAAVIANGATALLNLLSDLAGPGVLRDKLLACMGPQATLVEERAQVVYPTRKPYTANALALAGTNFGACTTANVSLSIQKFPDQAGRGRSGSFHVYGCPAASIVAGEWNAGYQATAALLGGMIAATYSLNPGGNDAKPVIWSRLHPTTPSNVLNCIVKSTVRTMHRRTLGLGI